MIHFIDRPRGYLWSFPRRDHLAVGACAQADGRPPESCTRMSTAGSMHAQRANAEAPIRVAHPVAVEGRIWTSNAPAGGRWMLLGDAAGLVDPITREGIFFALRSGSLAAAALAGSDPSTTYGHSIRQGDPFRDQAGRSIARVVFSASLPAALDWRAGPEPAIRRVMVDLIGGRQPYAGLRREVDGDGENWD